MSVGHVGRWVSPERRHDQGPRPQPRGRPLPQWRDAHVVKSYRRRRLVGGQPRVVFGTRDRGKPVRSAGGGPSQTACVERRTLALRQRGAAVGRRVTTLCQGEDRVGPPWVWCPSDHNVCLPHASFRRPLRHPEPTNGTGSAKRWPPCTPAMGAGVTDQVWSVRDVWRVRGPPWPHPQALSAVIGHDEDEIMEARGVHTQRKAAWSRA
jgi:hypothetical protein